MTEFMAETYPDDEQDYQTVEFVAEVRQVKTMVDGSIHVVLNLPEYCKPQAKKFIDWQGLMVKCVAELGDAKDTDYGL